MNIIIRKTRGADTEEIYNLLRKTWLVIYPNKQVGITPEDVELFLQRITSPENLEIARSQFENPKPEWLFLVAEDQNIGRIVGTLTIGRLPEYNKLKSIYILPEYQGKGIGKMFWAKALEFFDNTKDTIVEVATYNSQAIKFYESLGFVDTGERFTEERHRMPISGVAIPEMRMIIRPKNNLQ
jgi:ribosomal protein S18 acetylase RimI-like enzyme